MRNKHFRIVVYIFVPILVALVGIGMVYLTKTSLFHLLKDTIMLEETESISEDNQETKTSYESEWKDTRLAPADESMIADSQNTLKHDSLSKNIIDNTVIKVNDIKFPELATQYAMLYCDRIDMEVPIYWGDTDEVLDAGIGQYMGSFLPGFERSILLSGHNTTYFKVLEQIEAGDVVKCNTNYGEYQYVVDEITIIDKDDAEALMERMLSLKNEKLIMYTCYPFTPTISTKRQRLFVFANKLSGPMVEY